MLKNMSFTLRKNLKLNATFIHKIKIILDSFLSPHFHNCRGGGGGGEGVNKPTTRTIATRTTPRISQAKKKSLLAGYKFDVHGISVAVIQENKPVHALYKSYVKLRGVKFY